MIKNKTRAELILQILKDKTAIETGILHSYVFGRGIGELRSRISEIRKSGLAKIDKAVKYRGLYYYIRDDKNVMDSVQKAQAVKVAYVLFAERMLRERL